MARIKHGTVSAGQVDVTLDGNYEAAEVLARSGDAELWILPDPTGSGSIVEVDDCDVVPASGGSVIVESQSSTDPTVIRLETSGTVSWTVKGLR